MKPSNLEAIQRSFEKQAVNFESKAVNFSKEEYLDYTLSCVQPDKSDALLEVAAGTCVCGLSFAPFVQKVVCLDATVPMLQIGKTEAKRCHLDNIVFIKGYAEELPFLDEDFDIVFSRLAFHHFPDINNAFSEMTRVLKPGGKLVMIDMEAPAEPLRHTRDEIETLRDPSHIKNLSSSEMKDLFNIHGHTLETCTTTEMTQRLENWLALTQTPESIKTEIRERMEEELKGQAKTGFFPYRQENEIFFNQKWILNIGRKNPVG